jgi:hypothetical protein
VRKNIKNGPLSESLRKQGAIFFAWVFIIDLNKNAHLLACLRAESGAVNLYWESSELADNVFFSLSSLFSAAME